MNTTFVAACIQNSAGADMDRNLEQASELVLDAARQGAQLILLPEYFSCLDVQKTTFHVGPYAEADHPALDRMSRLAKECNIWILCGSLAIAAGDGKIANRSILVNADGVAVARYDKIHLFDVDLEMGESYRESATIRPGDEAVVAGTPWGGLGLSICYDLRFPHLYRTLAKSGARFLVVPSAFARTTGEVHWHVLLRSRAIETGSYVIAPCQTGLHGDSESYGHSLIVDPWGKVLVDGGTEVGVVIAEIDSAKVEDARGKIPALKHDRSFHSSARAELETAAQ